MRSIQRLMLFSLALVCCGVLFNLSCLMGLLGTPAVRAQQPAKPAAQKPAGDDEPVAITDRTKVEKKPVVMELANDQFGNFRYPLINNKGAIAFIALFNSPMKKNGADQAVFIKFPDGSWKVARSGETASNLPEAMSAFGSLAAFNDNGELTFVGEFGSDAAKPAVAVPQLDPNDPNASGTPTAMNKSLYFKSADGLKSLAKLGEEVPNMPSHFSGFANASTNSKGTTAFIGTYSDPDGRGLFLVEQGKMRIIVRSGQRVGNGVEGSFSEHYYPAPINERNEVAFLGRIGDKAGIFVSRPAGVELIAMMGQPAVIKGSTFIGFGNRTPSINNKGDVAFAGFTDSAEAQRALFVKEGTGPVKMIAKTGDKVGDTNYAFSDFLSPAINARGEIAFMGMYGGRNRGMFLKTAKGIEPIAMLDQQVPGGTKEQVFNNFTQPSINDRGEVVFYAQLKDGAVGIYHRDEKGALRVVVRRGDKMPK